MTTLYRMAGARLAIDHCRRIGVVLIVNGTGVHAVPTVKLREHPGLLAMVQRYRAEIMMVMDALVE